MKLIKHLLFSCIILFFILNGSLSAHEKLDKHDWIMDEQYLLSESTTRALNQILGSAENRNILLRVLLLKIPSSEKEIREIAKQKILEWESKYPRSQKKISYLVVDVGSRQNFIFIGENIHQTAALNESILRIQTDIIKAALMKENVAYALIEGSTALTTVFNQISTDKVFKKSSFGQRIIQWLMHYHLILPLKITFGFGFLMSIYLGLRRFFHTPHWEENMKIDTIDDEERILNNLLIRPIWHKHNP